MQPKFIHLLYVPTMNCNMRCSYCYLGENTVDSRDRRTPVETLRFAVEKFRDSGVVPFNISLHGGEVTTLSREDFRQVVAFVDGYYSQNRQLLTENGFKVGRPHIKTNLYGLDRHLDTIRAYNVSISGSLDLPLSLHRQYRLTKGGGDTLDKILENIRLLADLPNRKKVSATLFREHFERLDEIVADIRYLHENTCLDMNDFNFMIGFDAGQPGAVRMTPMTGQEQAELFDRMHREFSGTDLQSGLDNAWFAEFSQAYCTNCDLCGEKFFLLERNGDIYSCVRGQGDPRFFYGNIYTDSVEQILRRGAEQCFTAHNRAGFDPACGACPHLYLCKTGCPYVKTVCGSPRSYTCLLQKKLYEKKGEPAGSAEETYRYVSKVHPTLAAAYYPQSAPEQSLPWLIARDPRLQKVYDPGAFVLVAEGEEYPLESQLLKVTRQILFLTDRSELRLYIRKDVLQALSEYPVNNSLYMMLLSGDTVVYGDEQREKQAHIMTQQVYTGVLERLSSDRPGWYCVELMPMLRPWLKQLARDVPNNLFFTTADLRDYHYQKQRNNGYYHREAMNLPFQNVEFYYVDIEEELADAGDPTQDL